jgi:Xaa-Pro dipeptidase
VFTLFAEAKQSLRVLDLLAVVERSGADLGYVAAPPNLAYLCGVALNPHERLTALLLGPKVEPTLVVPAIDAERARTNPAGVAVVSWTDADGPEGALREALGGAAARRLALEKRAVTVATLELLQATLGVEEVVADVSGALADLRLRKTAEEVAAIERAAAMLDGALGELEPLLVSGAAEQDLVAALDALIRSHGSEGIPFDTMVLGGPQSALPHGVPGARELQEGDLVCVDAGAASQGYCADITRMFAIGEPSEEARHVYDVVRLAQATACEAVAPGVTCAEIDRAARDVIERAGYGEAFVHRTGHGLGIEVHEPPSLMAGEHLVLEPGMVFTVEPGIYLPGRFGVRIEDDVAVTEDGFAHLTTAPRDLVVCPAI